MTELFAAFGINWKLLLVQAINFSLLLAVLWRFLYTPLLKIIDERRTKIEEGVKTAEEARMKLEAANVESEGIVGDADRKAEGILAAARTQAHEKGGELVKDAEARAKSILADAAARAEEARRQALLSSEREIAKVAMLAAEKILKQKTA